MICHLTIDLGAHPKELPSVSSPAPSSLRRERKKWEKEPSFTPFVDYKELERWKSNEKESDLTATSTTIDYGSSQTEVPLPKPPNRAPVTPVPKLVRQLSHSSSNSSLSPPNGVKTPTNITSVNSSSKSTKALSVKPKSSPPTSPYQIPHKKVSYHIF